MVIIRLQIHSYRKSLDARETVFCLPSDSVLREQWLLKKICPVCEGRNLFEEEDKFTKLLDQLFCLYAWRDSPTTFSILINFQMALTNHHFCLINLLDWQISLGEIKNPSTDLSQQRKICSPHCWEQNNRVLLQRFPCTSFSYIHGFTANSNKF